MMLFFRLHGREAEDGSFRTWEVSWYSCWSRCLSGPTPALGCGWWRPTGQQCTAVIRRDLRWHHACSPCSTGIQCIRVSLFWILLFCPFPLEFCLWSLEKLVILDLSCWQVHNERLWQHVHILYCSLHPRKREESTCGLRPGGGPNALWSGKLLKAPHC